VKPDSGYQITGKDRRQRMADALDQAVLESLLATYADTDLVESAARAARLKAEASVPSVRSEQRSIDATIPKAEESLARSLSAAMCLRPMPEPPALWLQWERKRDERCINHGMAGRR
jgi:hypothetical protein